MVPLQGTWCRMQLACSRPLSWRMTLNFGVADVQGTESLSRSQCLPLGLAALDNIAGTELGLTKMPQWLFGG